MHDMSLQVEPLEVRQEIIDPVQDPPAKIVHLRSEYFQIRSEMPNHIHREREDSAQSGTGKGRKQQRNSSNHHELDENQRQRLEEHSLDGDPLGIEYQQESQSHDYRVDEQGDREAQILSEQKLIPRHRLGHNCIDGLLLDLFAYQSDPDENGNQHPEEINAPECNVQYETVEFPQGET